MTYNAFQSSAGHNFCIGEWLDIHFDAAKAEYEKMIRSIGIKPGDIVLDAGAGNGRFLDIIAEIVGPTGKAFAVDLAPENIESIQKRLQTFACDVKATVGNIFSLPYPDNSFDVVWCAAVTQYLNADELAKALAEFKRVVRPGGIVAVKEYDGTLTYMQPTHIPFLVWRSVLSLDEQSRTRWLIHPLEMSTKLKEAGLKNTKQETFLVERRQPLLPIEKTYLSLLFEFQDVCWTDVETLPEEEQLEWKSLFDVTSPNHILNNPNFFWREGHIVATGIKPV